MGRGRWSLAIIAERPRIGASSMAVRRALANTDW
jgi:hypothetical protein